MKPPRIYISDDQNNFYRRLFVAVVQLYLVRPMAALIASVVPFARTPRSTRARVTLGDLVLLGGCRVHTSRSSGWLAHRTPPPHWETMSMRKPETTLTFRLSNSLIRRVCSSAMSTEFSCRHTVLQPRACASSGVALITSQSFTGAGTRPFRPLV